MFRMFNCGEGKKELRELSIKQRQHLVDYERDKSLREWPPLPRVAPTPNNTPRTKVLA